jgi:oligopeptide transport system ATP-binding protein
MQQPMLSVNDLRTWFRTAAGPAKAVDGVSFDVQAGETIAIVGESGSGKSVTGLSLLRIVPEGRGKIISGSALFKGVDLMRLPERELRKVRGREISMIFQDPMTALNPYLRISTQITEMTRLHLGYGKRQAREHAAEMLRTVGIADAERRLDGYPHELSGGMRQRVMIAIALSCSPALLIADEPTTALDVTIQAQILELIRELKSRLGTSVLLITHDLGVVSGMADRVIVMYAGHIFEEAPARSVFSTPANPYTRGLLASVPDLVDGREKELFQIPGQPPDIANLPEGCPFADRCYRAEDICMREFPPMVEVAAGHRSLCHFAGEVFAESINGGPLGGTDLQ